MISVCILTKNSAATLEKTLESTRGFPEVLLFDSGSTDATFSIAQKFSNVRVVKTDFIGFGPMRNKIAALAQNDWVLALDSDETLSPSLQTEIFTLRLDPKNAYVFLRRNFYNGKQIRGCGWGNDKVARLYCRKSARFSDAAVHESLQGGKRVCCKSPLLHTPYRSTAEFLFKMQHYSSLFAEQNRGKKSSFAKALGSAIFAFFKSYFLKRGIFDGKEGFVISLYNANTAFYKYLKLLEKHAFHLDQPLTQNTDHPSRTASGPF